MEHLKAWALFFTLFLTSCKMTDEHIENKPWKYGSGYYLGDWVEFKNTHLKLKHDTIFDNNKPVAVVINRNKSMFSGNKIILQSLSTKEKGTYNEK